MTTPLPKEVVERIEREAKEYIGNYDVNTDVGADFFFTYIDAATREAQRSQVLIDALEKIADPRKRDHKEPDKYTECACMMNMAEVALASYLGTQPESEK